MTSTLDGSLERSSGDFKSAKTYFPSPAVIIPCGDKDFDSKLKKDDILDQRLKVLASKGLVGWGPLINLSEPVPKEPIADSIASFLRYDLWQRLVDEEFVEYLPDASHPLKIRFIILCDSSDKKSSAGLSDRLGELAAIIADEIGSRAEYSLILLSLGTPSIPIKKISAYWPRFYFGAVGYGGIQIDEKHILQACQNSLVAIISSEFERVVQYLVGDEPENVGWIALGASGILVDIDSTFKSFEPEVYRQFVEPLATRTLTDAQHRTLDEEMCEQTRKFQQNLFATAKSKDGEEVAKGIHEILNVNGWELEGQGPNVESCILFLEPLKESYPAKKIIQEGLGSGWWVSKGGEKPYILKQFPFYKKAWIWIRFVVGRLAGLFKSIPLPDTSKLHLFLKENYSGLDHALAHDLSYRVALEYSHLSDMFVYLLSPHSYPSDKEIPLKILPDRPEGLHAALYAVDSMIEKLSSSNGLSYRQNGISPAPQDDTEYWQVAAREDANWIESEVRRYQRLKRTILSPWGVVLKLIVAWPLLAGLLDYLTSWKQYQVILYSFLALVLLGFFELIYQEWKARDLLYKIRGEVRNCLQIRIFSLVAKTLFDYRMLALARLRSVRRILSELVSSVTREYEDVTNRCDDVARQPGSWEDGTLYWLLDYQKVLGDQTVKVENDLAKEWEPLEGEDAFVWKDTLNERWILSWKSEARRTANAEARRNSGHRNVEAALIAEHVFPLISKPSSGTILVNALRNLGRKYADKEFKTRFLETYILADQVEALSGGAKWKWLFQRAHPLGNNESAKNKFMFTVMLVPDDAYLSGATGKSEMNPYWKPDWLDARSRQRNEIICMRGIIERE